jgi:hypothetical protein
MAERNVHIELRCYNKNMGIDFKMSANKNPLAARYQHNLTVISKLPQTNIGWNLVCIHAFFVIPLYLQNLPVDSANGIELYTLACRRLLNSALL